MNERTATRDVHVMLVGGEHEHHTLAQVEVALRMRGMVPALVDAHADATIMDALARVSDSGLVVLARGPTFTADRVDAVRQLLAARGLPASRTLTLGMDEGARALETRVLATVQRLTASAAPRPATVPPVHSAFVEHAPLQPTAQATPTAEPAWSSEPEPHSSGRAPIVRRRWPLVVGASGAAIAAVLVTVGILRGIERDTFPAGTDTLATNETPSELPPSERRELPPSEPPASDAIATPELDIAEAPATPAPTPAVEDAPEVVAALRKRDVRALDLVVISPEAPKAADFTGATAYCDALVIGELDGWRLPEIGELLSMSRAKMVRRGSFWSSTKGDAFGDLRLVLVLKRERITPIAAGWNAGRVICVRERA